VKAPLKKPCPTCPYRRDVPSGVWAPEEYAKLSRYDLPTGEQPTVPFGCHQANGHLCSGWAAVHDMDNSLALRLQAAFHRISPEDYEATLRYESPVPVFDSGREAFMHGMTGVAAPGPEAKEAQLKLLRKIGRRGH